MAGRSTRIGSGGVEYEQRKVADRHNLSKGSRIKVRPSLYQLADQLNYTYKAEQSKAKQNKRNSLAPLAFGFWSRSIVHSSVLLARIGSQVTESIGRIGLSQKFVIDG